MALGSDRQPLNCEEHSGLTYRMELGRQGTSDGGRRRMEQRKR